MVTMVMVTKCLYGYIFSCKDALVFIMKFVYFCGLLSNGFIIWNQKRFGDFYRCLYYGFQYFT